MKQSPKQALGLPNRVLLATKKNVKSVAPIPQLFYIKSDANYKALQSCNYQHAVAHIYVFELFLK